MFRVIFQLTSVALTLAFLFYQNNVPPPQDDNIGARTFGAKRIKVTASDDVRPISDPMKHPNVWLMPVLDRMFGNPHFQQASASLGLITRGSTF